MDFLKTMLLYMSTTLFLAVQNTSAPVATPVPTPSPTPSAIVETVTVFPDVEETVTPSPTVSVTPRPVPTITPNTRAYHNLQQGDRGTEVRRLQERLIELGYLPEGAADGAYGGQTRNAVRRFQYYNGLTQDGIAGRATQTNLFENPDILSYAEATAPETAETAAPESPTPSEAESQEIPTPETAEAPAVTEAPTEMPTEAPTEAPTEVPTEVPTEAPSEVPTEVPTEAPTEVPTEAPTEVPTEAPTEVPTEAPTEVPTEAPTEAPTEVPTEGPTEVPTEAPTPEEIVEEVDLDALEYELLEGSIVLNDSGAPMSWTATEDGVPVIHYPRMQQAEGIIYVSLDDVAASVDGWLLTDDGDTIVLEAMGYTLGFYNESSGPAVTVDGVEQTTEALFFRFTEGHFIRADFLASMLNGEAIWDEEEQTLMLRIPEKAAAHYSD